MHCAHTYTLNTHMQTHTNGTASFIEMECNQLADEYCEQLPSLGIMNNVSIKLKIDVI